MYIHTQTIFNELMNFIPFRVFDQLVGQHKANRYKKKFSAKSLLAILMYAQITNKSSLRDIEISLSILKNNLYHWWIWSIKRSTISYNNNIIDSNIFENLFYALVREINKFNINKKINYYSLDSTTISLCFSLFPRAKYRTSKWAVKMHVMYNNQCYIPEVIYISNGKVADITAWKLMEIEKHLKRWDFIVFDKWYVDYKWYEKMTDKWIYFVTRTKKNMDYLVVEEKCVNINWIEKEMIIEVFNPWWEVYKQQLRLIKYTNKEDWNHYEFITNNMEIEAKAIAELYKSRWEIELFFKFIKQHLKVLTFLWTTENAVRNQLWIAMIYYLIVAYIKHKTNTKQSLLELMRIFSVSINLRVKILDLLGLTPQNVDKIVHKIRYWPEQLSLF